jgi:hypothetical protein
MSVSQLEKEFVNPSATFRSKPFWAWNDKLEEPELRRQIRLFREMGFGGFFMHSRVGLKTPYLSKEWFDLVRSCIDEAKKTGMESWLYDEDRWPSGSAGGIVTKDVKYRAQLLILTRHAHPERYIWPGSEKKAYIYGATFEDEKISWFKKLDQAADIAILPQGAEVIEFSVENNFPLSWFNNQTYLDTMSKEAVGKFIEVTHEAYKREVGDDFGKQIPGIFMDEPNRGAYLRNFWGLRLGIPWTNELPAKFEELFGYDIIQHIPEIVFDLVDKPITQTRYHYFCTTTRLFVENFSKQIGDWCESNHLISTGHVLEENPISHTTSVDGAAMQFYPYMQAPGIDILTQSLIEYISAKQVVSVAHQTGRKWILSELYGCTGWETTFETYKHSGDWQAAMGITLRCPHLSWYSMAGETKRDYPASIHYHSPWWKQYKAVEDYFARLGVLLSEGQPICDLAVIHPIESYYVLFDGNWSINPKIKEMDKQYEALVEGLLAEHLDFHFADEHLMVELKAQVGSDAAGAYLQIGQMKYRAILVPTLLTMRGTTLETLKTFAQAGGKVVFAGQGPEYIDAKVNDAGKTFAGDKTVVAESKAISDALGSVVRRVSIRDTQKEINPIRYQLRQIGDDWLLFMANTDRKNAYPSVSVKIDLDLPKGGQIQVWDAITGQRYKLAGELTYKSATFKIDLPVTGSRLIVIASEAQDLPVYGSCKPTGQEIVLTEEGWNYLLDDVNSLVLEKADATMVVEGKRKFTKSKMEVVQLDRAIREHLGLEFRGGAMTQPWAAEDQPLGPTGQLSLTYRFAVKAPPTTPVLLAIEQPERWQIRINDQLICSDNVTGWWVDPAIKTIPIDPIVFQKGKNILTLEGQFDRKADLELIYLLGQFGTETDGKSVAMTKLPTKLKLGSWLDQGLTFYSGNVTYRTNLELTPETGKRYILKFPKFEGTAIDVIVNGQTSLVTGWPEYQVDCTGALAQGKNTIDIKILGSRRNSFGPFHLTTDTPVWVGPDAYFQNPDAPGDWQEEIRLKNYGLYEAPVLTICEG